MTFNRAILNPNKYAVLHDSLMSFAEKEIYFTNYTNKHTGTAAKPTHALKVPTFIQLSCIHNVGIVLFMEYLLIVCLPLFFFAHVNKVKAQIM